MTVFLRRYRHQLTFLFKVGLCYGAWYVLYNLWLMPAGHLDYAIAHSVAVVVGKLVNAAGIEALAGGRSVVLDGVRGVFVADGCNGLSTIGLFVGFIVAYPGHIARRAFFLPFGTLVIYLANVGRVFAMALSQKYWPAGFDILHGSGMTGLFYVIILGLWMLWVNYGGSHHTSSKGKETRESPASSKRPSSKRPSAVVFGQ